MVLLDYETTIKLYDQAILPLAEGSRAVLFGAPSHTNAGDQAILLGACDYLHRIHDKVVVVKEFDSFDVNDSDMIYFLGGGNFGDLYPRIHFDKIRRLRTFRANRVVFLPQAVHFRKRRSVTETRKALAGYDGQLTLFVRDSESKSIAETLFDMEVQLLPDSAILLQPRLKEWGAVTEGEGGLYIARNDRESEMFLKLNLPTADLMSAGLRDRPELSLRLVTSLIAVRRLVISDRLHGALLAALIGRHSILLPNSYHKNEAFCKTWSLPGLVFASTEREVHEHMNRILPDVKVNGRRGLRERMQSFLAREYFQFGYRYLAG